jgi:hypothetical protein
MSWKDRNRSGGALSVFEDVSSNVLSKHPFGAAKDIANDFVDVTVQWVEVVGVVSACVPRVPRHIARLWCLLDIGEDARRVFLRAHSMLSAAVIESCAKEIEYFVGLRA